MECLARTFGHYSKSDRKKFLEVLQKQHNWEERLRALEALIEKLKAEGRYETAFPGKHGDPE